jgi:hypothetical protein
MTAVGKANQDRWEVQGTHYWCTAIQHLSVTGGQLASKCDLTSEKVQWLINHNLKMHHINHKNHRHNLANYIGGGGGGAKSPQGFR